MAREQLVARAEGLLRKRKLDARPFDAEGGTPESVADDPADDEAVAAAEETVPPVAVQPAPQQEPGPAPQAETDTPARTEAEAGADATPAPEAGTPAAETADSEPVTAPEASQAAPVSAGVDGPRQDEQMPLEAGYVWEPVLTGRKLQDALRKLREEWKTADSGGAPNQALWRRFDRACNTAHAFVMQWLEQVRAEEEKNAAERKAMIAQLRDWAAAQAGGAEADWKRVSRDLRRFSQRWRDAGHVAEKRYRALQQEWKQAMTAAGAPLEQAQKASQARRQDLIAQAQALGAEPELRINAIRALQASWQAEARAVPLNRKREQKLWEAFRKPLDEAFQRKDAERERRQAAISAHDEAVLAAARILEQANAGGDAARIREAMEALEAATRSQSQAAPRAEPASHGAGAAPAAPEGESENKDEGGAAAEPAADTGQAPADGGAAAEQPDAQPAPAQRPRRVVAVRGDDRPDAAKPRASRVAGPRPRDGQRRDDRGRRDERRPRNDRPGRERRGPAMGHSARRASQQAVDNAQQALRQLAARAHGEALVELLSAWRDGNAAQVPEARDFGRAVTPAVRNDWSDAVAATGGTPEQVNLALLRLEEAAEAPSPANQLDARRALKLQLLTQRDDPSPAETWPQDVGAVLASDYEAGKSERLQKALKILLQKR